MAADMKTRGTTGLPDNSTPLEVAAWMLEHGQWLAEELVVRDEDGSSNVFARSWEQGLGMVGAWVIKGRPGP